MFSLSKSFLFISIAGVTNVAFGMAKYNGTTSNAVLMFVGLGSFAFFFTRSFSSMVKSCLFLSIAGVTNVAFGMSKDNARASTGLVVLVGPCSFAFFFTHSFSSMGSTNSANIDKSWPMFE
ncbi:hypothetical protein Tco_1350546, partial [Tanacetum coccineum]